MQCTKLLDATGAHDGNAVGQSSRFPEVVCDQHRGETKRRPDVRKCVEQVTARDGVECAEGFIEQQCALFRGECTRERNALSLSTRKLMGIAVRKADWR